MIFESINPFDQSLLKQFEAEKPAQTHEKLQNAQKTFLYWKTLTLHQRIALVKRLGQIIDRDKQLFAHTISLEMGKANTEALIEIEKCIKSIDHFVENADSILEKKEVATTAHKSYFRFEPSGCILAIMPWNFPFWQVLRFAIPTILAGNVVLLKHAPNVQMCAEMLEQAFLEAGFEMGVFQNARIEIPHLEHVISSPIVSGVTLTGSNQAGKSVATLAGKYLKKCVLELGGSDPFVVLADADIENAARWAVKSRFQNAGQTCIAAKRWIVEADAYPDFVEAAIAHTQNLKVGNPFDAENNLGPMARLDLAKKIEAQAAELDQVGARKLLPIGRNGCMVQPGLLAVDRQVMYRYSEELFGPLATLIKAQNANQAIEIANETLFGLGASIWTHDLEKGENLAKNIQAGGVYINSMVKSHAALPFGGTKESGFGRELGSFGFTEFSNIKSYWIEK
jgi:succinate-semialdehyde dehydrogenase / glutarate-semialdehyde dehydrogenase